MPPLWIWIFSLSISIGYAGLLHVYFLYLVQRTSKSKKLPWHVVTTSQHVGVLHCCHLKKVRLSSCFSLGDHSTLFSDLCLRLCFGIFRENTWMMYRTDFFPAVLHQWTAVKRSPKRTNSDKYHILGRKVTKGGTRSTRSRQKNA